MAEGGHHQELTEDRKIGDSDIKKIGWPYMRKQLANLNQAANMLMTPGAVPHQRQQDVYHCAQAIQGWRTRISNLMDRLNLDQHGHFAVVTASAPLLLTSKDIPHYLGEQCDPNLLMPMISRREMDGMPETVGYITGLQRLASQMESDPLQWIRNIGYTVKIIASNMQNCLHSFSSHHFAPGPFPATADYPVGPQPPSFRYAFNLESDSRQLAADIGRVHQYPPMISASAQALHNQAAGLLQAVQTNDYNGIVYFLQGMRQQWDFLLDYLCNNTIMNLDRHTRWTRILTGDISTSLHRLEQLFPPIQIDAMMQQWQPFHQ